jgi:DNA repair exonuclease SbcCD ATPase subunit
LQNTTIQESIRDVISRLDKHDMEIEKLAKGTHEIQAALQILGGSSNLEHSIVKESIPHLVISRLDKNDKEIESLTKSMHEIQQDLQKLAQRICKIKQPINKLKQPIDMLKLWLNNPINKLQYRVNNFKSQLKHVFENFYLKGRGLEKFIIIWWGIVSLLTITFSYYITNILLLVAHTNMCTNFEFYCKSINYYLFLLYS